ncbi:MAG: YceI family protein [Schleiferiaceae bacterium]
MKKIAMFMAASVLAVSCAGEKAEEVTTGEAQEVIEVAEAKTFNLIDSSTVVWRGFKTFVDWSHEGTIAVDGKFLIANDKVAGGFIEIDFSEITVAEFADGTKEEYLLGHIRSEDFFFTDSFPTGSFEIVNVKELAGEGTNSLVVGNLTLRGITNSIEFPANINLDNDGVSFEAPVFSIDRTKWGVKYHDREDASIAASLKEDLIDHSIELKFNVRAKA